MVVLVGQTQLLGSLPLQEKIPAAVRGSGVSTPLLHFNLIWLVLILKVFQAGPDRIQKK